MNDVLDKLRELKFIGPFPLGIEVLLVSNEIAFKEINFQLESNFTANTFRTFLKKNDIFVFNSVEEWAKYKNPQK